ncbi:uncharacterized protein LOC134287353 [Aedes albopictus]|uniref:PHD-type domain-containing protein n=1 Tax=Aedes albopictus TaxID=7160 RepID=A0ABM1YY85_AEDAL
MMSASNPNPTMQEGTHSCKNCNRPDNAEDMVACDKCNGWWHFSCAGVQASICDRSWRCPNCSTFCGTIGSENSNASSARLRLKQLEEAKALEDKIRKEQADREREFLAAKHQLETEIEARQSVGGSLRSHESHRSRRSRVGTWVADQDFTIANRAIENHPPQTGKTSTPILTGQVGTGATTKILPPPLNTQTSQHERPTDHQQPSVTPTNEQVSHLSSNTPLGIPKHLLPPTKPSGIPETSFPLVNSSRIAEPDSSHLPNVLGAVHPQSQPAPMSKSVSYYPALPAPPPIYSLGTMAQELASTEGPLRTASRMPPVCPVDNLKPSLCPIKPSLPPMTTSILPPINTSSSHQLPPPPVDPSGSTMPSLHANQPRVMEHRVGFSRHPGNGDPPRSWLNSSQPIIRDASADVGHMPAPPNRIPPQPSCYVAPPQLSQSDPASHSWYQQPMPPYWQQPYWQPQYPVQNSFAGIINPQQLAARHVVSRELPKFSGDPLEWPMFLSAFESTTSMCGIQPDENLARLQKCLVGKAREKVHSILTLPEAIPEIINTLRDECGRPDQLVHCLMSKIRNAPAPNVNKLDTLITFGREVRNLVTYIEAANLQAHLSNPMLLTELVGKLPQSIRLDWGLHTQRIPEVTLKAFSDFVSSMKTAACQVAMPFESNPQDDVVRSGKKKEKSGYVHTHSAEVDTRSSSRTKPEMQQKLCLMCQSGAHRIKNCDKFSSLTIIERWRLVEQRNMCQRCLTCHGKWPCRTSQPCGMDGCGDMHHKLLHPGKPKPAPSGPKGPGSSGVVTTHRSQQHGTFFKILPVTLSHNGKSVTTFAFFDDGSNVTLLESSIADMLDLDGEESSLCLQWTSDVTRKESVSKRVKVCISGDGTTQHLLSQVQTVDNLGLPRQSLNYTELSVHFPHLRGLPIQSYTDAVPRILIGADNARLKLPLKKRERRDEEPVAIKTKLGWTIFGGQRGSHAYNRMMVHVCDCSADQRLHDLVKHFFDVEHLGITAASTPESKEDERARRILQETTRRTESGRFETGLLWRSDDVHFPESYGMAERRLKCLERRLQSDPELQINVEAQIADY